MGRDVAGLEAELRAAVAARLGEARFGLWFGEGVRLGIDGDALEVGVPNAFFREWIQGHFAGNLIEAAEEVAGRSLKLAFRIDDEAEPQVGHVVDLPPPGERRRPTVAVPAVPKSAPRPGHAPSPSPSPNPAPPPPERPRSSARPLRRLDDFVTGGCNRLAH